MAISLKHIKRNIKATSVSFFLFSAGFILFLIPLVDRYYTDLNAVPDTAIFSNIYKKDLWVVGSGPGSVDFATVEYRKLLQNVFNDTRFHSFVDLGCGDFQIMRLMTVPDGKKYRCIEVVPDVINENRRIYGNRTNYEFTLIDDLRDLKLGSDILQDVDMLIIKDVLIHLPNSDIHYFIDNILPSFKYALITNNFCNDNTELNVDIKTGGFRPVDLTYPPFNLLNKLELVLRYALGVTQKRVYFYTNPKLYES